MNSIVYVGMYVHKESFTLCCYALMRMGSAAFMYSNCLKKLIPNEMARNETLDFKEVVKRTFHAVDFVVK